VGPSALAPDGMLGGDVRQDTRRAHQGSQVRAESFVTTPSLRASSRRSRRSWCTGAPGRRAASSPARSSTPSTTQRAGTRRSATSHPPSSRTSRPQHRQGDRLLAAKGPKCPHDEILPYRQIARSRELGVWPPLPPRCCGVVVRPSSPSRRIVVNRPSQELGRERKRTRRTARALGAWAMRGGAVVCRSDFRTRGHRA
jgi:hypothetical protein